MSSYKTKVIERLFFARWDQNNRQLRDPVVTLTDIQEEIRESNRLGIRASDKNAANFLYDLIRKQSANANWPQTVFKAGYSGKQLLGTGQCFEFVKLDPSATEPFPNYFGWTADTPNVPVQCLSMPMLTRSFARTDEAAILQATISLRILETHFALLSETELTELTHIQMSLRFKDVTIDALFEASSRKRELASNRVFITCEAKQHDEVLLEDRLIRQVQAAASLPLAQHVIPVAVQRVERRGIYVVEFKPIAASQAQDLQSLTLAKAAIYEIRPRIEGF